MENILLKMYRQVMYREVERHTEAEGSETRTRVNSDPPFKVRFVESYAVRAMCTKRYSWAVPTEEAIRTIVKYSPIVEIGAGTGYWAKLIEEAGGDIIAFDKEPPRNGLDANQYHPNRETVFPVRQGTEEVSASYPDRALFLCWPPYASVMAFQALRGYLGKTVIFVGEGQGGCTANDEFFEVLERKYTLVEEVSIPQWTGIHDHMTVWQRASFLRSTRVRPDNNLVNG